MAVVCYNIKKSCSFCRSSSVIVVVRILYGYYNDQKEEAEKEEEHYEKATPQIRVVSVHNLHWLISP